MSAEPLSLDAIGAEARAFRDAFMTLHLATCTAAAQPVASYAPYALSADGGFYIYVSELAAHTENLKALRETSVLFIEAERDAEHLFARKRLTYTCAVTHLPRGEAPFERALDALALRFGDFIAYLRTLKDFHAFELCPRHASYVRGFAQAFELAGGDFDQVRHVNDRGHRDD
jgi:putative heme iron utilization protein